MIPAAFRRYRYFYMFIRFLCGQCCMLCLQHCPAQEYNYIHYTTKDGLAGETVHNILQDKEGFIWFATETGLSRFDGTKFRNFTREDGLPSNEVFAFYQDSQDRLWILSFKNELCYYYKGRIYNRSNDRLLNNLELKRHPSYIWETDTETLVIHDNTNGLVFITNNWSVHTSTFIKYITPSELLGRKLPSKRAIPFPCATLPLFAGKILTDYIWPYGAYISRVGSVYMAFNYVKDRFAIIDTTSKRVIMKQEAGLQDIVLADDHRIWKIRHAGGALLYDFILDKAVGHFLPDEVVHSVYEDREGNLWFSTRGNGVFKLGRPQIVSYMTGQGAASPAIQFLLKKGGALYASDDNGGCYKLEQDKKKAPGAFPAWRIRKVTADVRWLKGEQDRYIDYASSDFLDLEPGRTRSVIKSLFVFNDTLLYATAFGTFLQPIRDTIIYRWLHKNRTTCAFKLGQEYYIGTVNGLYIYNAAGQLLSRPVTGRVSYFTPGADGTLWMATYDGGVYRFRDGKITGNINQRRNGLSSNICRCLFLSGRYLWIGTDKGVNRVDVADPALPVISKYSMADGLNANIINTIYVDDSLVYIGTQKGLNCFNEKQVPRHTSCSLKMTGITVSGIDRPVEEFLVLAHKDNNIKFEFSGLSFLSGGNITYQYRLLGLNDDWQTTTDQVLGYPSLPAGKYTLQVKAINKFGDVSPLLEKNFMIRKTLYEEWWFRLLLVFMIAILLLAVARVWTKRVRNKEAEKRKVNQKVLELEQQALRAQMNPHFIFNCLNSIQNYIIRKDSEGANFYLSQFAGLVRQTLDNATRIYIILAEEILYIKSYLELERLQYGASFSYKINVTPDISPAAIDIPNMIIQPYVENATKHGFARMRSGGELSIDFSFQEEAAILECIIEDNGPGIDFVRQQLADRAHTSKGMSITRERIDMLNRLMEGRRPIEVHIEDLSRYGRSGTRVVIRFPVREKNKQLYEGDHYRR